MTVQEKLAALMALAYEVNSKTKYAVFCEFAGHVNWISLRVAAGKNYPNSHDIIFPENYKKGKMCDISLNRDNINRIDEWMEFLNGLLEKATATA